MGGACPEDWRGEDGGGRVAGMGRRLGVGWMKWGKRGSGLWVAGGEERMGGVWGGGRGADVAKAAARERGGSGEFRERSTACRHHYSRSVWCGAT